MAEIKKDDKSMKKEKLTLHEAIIDIIKHMGALRVPIITWVLNHSDLYEKKDKSEITASQVHARIRKYPQLFYIDETRHVCLR